MSLLLECGQGLVHERRLRTRLPPSRLKASLQPLKTDLSLRDTRLYHLAPLVLQSQCALRPRKLSGSARGEHKPIADAGKLRSDGWPHQPVADAGKLAVIKKFAAIKDRSCTAKAAQRLLLGPSGTTTVARGR